MKISSEVEVFLQSRGFDSAQLNKINRNKVTPLSVAIEEGKQHVVQELLELGANPTIINGHGNTCLFLAQGQKDIFPIIEAATKRYTCKNITCITNTKFSYNSIVYRVIKSIGGGACSLGVLVLQNEANDELYILKVKQVVTPMEIRNNIILGQFVDVFNIEYFNNDSKSVINVQGLIEKFVPGIMVYDAITNVDLQDKDQIIMAAIVALCTLHNNSIIHGDALSTNCIWEEKTAQAKFVDFETMQISSDMTSADFEMGRFADLHRLIFGDVSLGGTNVFGLRNYTKNILVIIANIPDQILGPILKAMLKAEVLQGTELLFSRNARMLNDPYEPSVVNFMTFTSKRSIRFP